MKLSIFIIFFIYPLNSFAQSVSFAKHRVEVAITPLAGMRVSHLQFNIAATEDGGTPNILSELIWRKNFMYMYGIESSVFFKNFNLNSSFICSQGFSGTATDTDYAEDNRKSPFFVGEYSSDASSMKNLNIDFGYSVNINKNIILQPSCFFNFNWRKFMILNSRNIDNDNFLPGLSSYYKITDPNYGIKLSSRFLYHRLIFKNYFGIGVMNFKAFGNWNLREDLQHPKSYIQNGNGWASNIGTGLDLELSPFFYFIFNYNFNYQRLERGLDSLYRIDGTVIQTRLNENLLFDNQLFLGFKLTY